MQVRCGSGEAGVGSSIAIQEGRLQIQCLQNSIPKVRVCDGDERVGVDDYRIGSSVRRSSVLKHAVGVEFFRILERGPFTLDFFDCVTNEDTGYVR